MDDYESLRPLRPQPASVGTCGKTGRRLQCLPVPGGEENGFVNGVNLPVDGGMTRRMIYPETDPLWTE